MLIQQIHTDPWRMLVCCILLNLTTRKQVDKVVDELFERWPTAERMFWADESELQELLRPLGMWRKRTNTLRTFSYDWMRTYIPGEPVELSEMYGIGRYAIDSYKIFQLGMVDIEVTDKELKKYLEGLKNADV
jgi:methyl-CpG-binding domain protein 4